MAINSWQREARDAVGLTSRGYKVLLGMTEITYILIVTMLTLYIYVSKITKYTLEMGVCVVCKLHLNKTDLEFVQSMFTSSK